MSTRYQITVYMPEFDQVIYSDSAPSLKIAIKLMAIHMHGVQSCQGTIQDTGRNRRMVEASTNWLGRIEPIEVTAHRAMSGVKYNCGIVTYPCLRWLVSLIRSLDAMAIEDSMCPV